MRPALSRSLVLLTLAALFAALVTTHSGAAPIAEPATIDVRFDSELATRISGPSTNLSNGITFDHATWNDPVRMVGEPDIVIDNASGIYVSGPGGSTTQASWFWKSTDKGVQWHLVGCLVKSNCQNGGGDTEITVANNRDVFASDLQTLLCNSALRSVDEGNTWTTGEACIAGTDRQWMANYDPTGTATNRRIYLSANGQAAGCYLLVSTDNGLHYLPPSGLGTVGGSCIGRLAVNPANGHIYIPNSGGTKVSIDGGATFITRPRPSGVQGNFFANLAIDTAGNLWQGWTTSCGSPATNPCKTFISYSTDEAQTWSTPLQINTGLGSPQGANPDLRQVLFPWTVVGDPGRVAVVYYGTTDTARNPGGYPGGSEAAWQVYIAISTNAMDANPTWTQVQASEHVMHRNTVCTGGFPGCLLDNADRSMADFFAVDKDAQGRLYIAYNENSDLSEVLTQVAPNPPVTEYIGKPINAAIRLRTGPSLFASQGNLLPTPTPANVDITTATLNAGTLTANGTHGLPPGNWSSDPAADAIFPVVPTPGPNFPAFDIREVSASDNGTNLTFKLKMASLAAADLAAATAIANGSPSWMVVWWQSKGGTGPGSGPMPPYHSHWFMKWLGATNEFVYGRVGSISGPALGAPTPKALTYVPMGTAAATSNVSGNDVTINVPLASLGGLAAGDKIEHIIGYALTDHLNVTLTDWVDQVKAFSYRIGTPAGAQHFPDGYVELSVNDPNFTNPVVATLNSANNAWTAAIPGVPLAGTVCARQVLSKDLYTPLWDDVQAGPVDCMNYGPTAVTVRSFAARRIGRAVVLRWRTGSEAQAAGFNLYRDRVKLNKRLIPVVGGTRGHSYAWRDRHPGKAPRYTLELVRRDGSKVRLAAS